jgi:endoglycosylceramidase
MNSVARAAFGFFAAACLLGCSSKDEAKDEEAGPTGWHVSGGFLRTPDGRRAVVRGANLAGAHKHAPYFGFHEPTDYQRLRDVWGMNAIRFLIVWAAIEPEKGVYDEAYLDGIAERMGWARDAGLRVVIDMHQDVYGEGFGFDGAPRWTCDESRYTAFKPHDQWFLNYLDPNVIACVDGFYSSEELVDHYIEAWRRVAEKVRDNEAVVGFDVMNEPAWGSASMNAFEETILQGFYEKLVPKVRAVAPGWVAFLEPGANRNLGVATGLVKFPFDNVVYSPHAYSSAAELGSGFDPSARNSLMNNIALLRSEADALDAALWIGEYGGTTSSAGIMEYMDAGYDGTAAVAAANVYWAYDANSGGYGMLEDDQTDKPVLLDALVRPFPELTAGDPVSWEYDETTRKFTYTWHPDPKVKEPTVISVAPRIYPTGYDVTCDGCTTEASPGKLTITQAPSGDPAVIAIAPKP